LQSEPLDHDFFFIYIISQSNGIRKRANLIKIVEFSTCFLRRDFDVQNGNHGISRLFMVALGARKFNANFYTKLRHNYRYYTDTGTRTEVSRYCINQLFFLTAFFFTSFYVKYLCLVFWNLQQAAVLLFMSMTIWSTLTPPTISSIHEVISLRFQSKHLFFITICLRSTLPPSRQVGTKSHADSGKQCILGNGIHCRVVDAAFHAACTKS
ncbi:hypothetical protein T4B_7153, partial [Trichinella pseudospiralis]